MSKAARIKRERKEGRDLRHTVVSKKKKPAQGGLTQLITYIIAHRPRAPQRPTREEDKPNEDL